MRDKRKLPTSAVGPLGSSTLDEGGNRSSTWGGTQPPYMGPQPGPVEVPIGALVRYLGTHRRITFDDWQSDHAIVLDRKLVHREVVGGPQPNPDVWPVRVSVILIQWLQESGQYADDRWKPRSWLEKDGELVCKRGWQAGRGPVWVMERAGTGTGKNLWEVLE
jgi:hypothetical protein